MDKDIILNIVNEAIKGRSPKRALIDVYNISRRGDIEPIIADLIRSRESTPRELKFIESVTRSVRVPSDLITIVTDYLEANYLRKRVKSLIQSYRRKGIILLAITYILFPFVASTIGILTSIPIGADTLAIQQTVDRDIQQIKIALFSLYLETIPTIYISRIFGLNIRKLVLVQTLLFIPIYVTIQVWAIHWLSALKIL